MITVNGRELDHVEGESINRLLKRMRYNFPLVIVKLNGQMVDRNEFISTKIPDEARLEVIHLTSGG